MKRAAMVMMMMMMSGPEIQTYNISGTQPTNTHTRTQCDNAARRIYSKAKKKFSNLKMNAKAKNELKHNQSKKKKNGSILIRREREEIWMIWERKKKCMAQIMKRIEITEQESRII